MITVKVNLKDNAYDIVIGHGILEDLGAALRSLTIGQDALVITHPVIRRLHGKTLATGLKRNGFSVRFLEVPAGERSKSFPAAIRLIQQSLKVMLRRGFLLWPLVEG